jgi:hypothetical protein
MADRFDWMRTGTSPVEATDDPMMLDFMRKVSAILKVLITCSFETAAKFAQACGRDTVTDYDLNFALKYESEAFWHRDIDAAFSDALAEEREHTYTTDDEESEDEASEEGSVASDGSPPEVPPMDETDPPPSFACLPNADPSLRQHHADVTRAVRAWEDWHPDDPVKNMLRRAVEESCAVLPPHTLP